MKKYSIIYSMVNGKTYIENLETKNVDKEIERKLNADFFIINVGVVINKQHVVTMEINEL